MNWKNLPYWVKGGIIGGIPFFLGILYLLFGFISIGFDLGASLWVLIILYIFTPLMSLGMFVGWIIGRKKFK